MVFALGLAACTGGEQPPPVSASPLDQSWMGEVVRTPAAFTAVVDPDREGWIALHRSDWKAAQDSVSPAGPRARQALAELHGVLSLLEARALQRLDAAWLANGGSPVGSAWPVYGAIAAGYDDDPAAATSARARLSVEQSTLYAGLADPALPGAHPLTARRRLHDGVIDGSRPVGDLLAAVDAPVVQEPTGGTTRDLWDPWTHHTLARWYAAPATTSAAEPSSLAARLFSARIGPGPTLDDTLAALGVPIVPADRDDPQACREAARALDGQLDAWSTAVAAGLADDGRALFTDLRLVPVARARILEALAIAALPEAPNCSLAYALLAQDHGDSRAINAVNTPTLFAVIATAQLSTGHTREALDALEPLTAAFPEIHGLDETVGDLAILQGIHRTGDSREN